MSDQPSPTQKTKPGSLRDRIAAFEKSAGAPPVNTPPPPRPKPAGFATWKPKQASPPSSPPAASAEHVQGSSARMSASDARESITKGASLKERMAALQNKGAFGAPPPVGPKPAAERPKWKPPPVVPSEEGDGPSEGISAIEKSISPPTTIRPEQSAGDSVQSEQDPTHGSTAEGDKEDAEIPQDPEEEERQRRAAIAARMARLGGARVGMAPPSIGKKPLVRRSTQDEQQKPVEDTKPAEVPLHPESGASPEESVSVSSDRKPGPTPSRKSSVNITAEVALDHSPKIPASMPVPAVPRRPGPPRKKSSKPTAPVPEPPKEETAPAVLPEVDIAESASGPVHEVPESTSEASIGVVSKDSSSIIEDQVPALAGDLEEPSDDSEEPEKAEVVKPAETASPPPPPDLPPAQTLETSGAIEIGNEDALQHSSLPSVTPPGQTTDSDVSNPATEVIEHEEVEDDISEKTPISEPLGGRSNFSADPVPVPEEPHSEPSESVPEDFLHEDDHDQSEVVNYDYKSDKPSDQNPRAPLPIPTKRPSISSTEFDTPKSIDSPHLAGHGSASLERKSAPRRIVPATPERDADQELVEEPESDDEVGEILAQSHLFIPPPKEGMTVHRYIQDEDDGGDGSENDAPALPVPHRRSLDMRASRSVPATLSDGSSDPETDHDGRPLPVPPRPASRVLPPARSQESSRSEGRNASISISPFPLDREVMDEDEGDPIDPDFHSPSRPTSLAHQASPPSSHAAPPQQPPIPGSRPPYPLQPVQHISPPEQTSPPEESAIESEEDAAETRRRTIAERMAKLGGIKFGAAPVPRSIPSAIQDSERADASGVVEEKPDDVGNEEEEERARKERIAAKLASMGGKRIGMMPISMGVPPKASQPREESLPSSPPNPVAPVRPSRVAPQPPEQNPNPERDIGSPNTSDDGVRVEAEESEAEEVNYQDTEPEEIPPIPSRSGRPTRRQSSGDTAVSPPPPARRPPVPATPSRRSSVQVSSPPPQRKNSSQAYDYVMVDQIESQEAQPTRRTSGTLARPGPEVSKTAESQENISSQWELPSIPTSALDSAGPDLSLSWTDAGDSVSSSQPTQSASRGKARRQPTLDKSPTIDDLTAMWGRVGVQVCEVATTLFEKSKKSLIGDGSYAGFVKAVLADVPNAAQVSIDAGECGYLIYSQNGGVVQKRASDVMPGDIVEIHDARFKGHKGLQTYQLTVGGSGELVVGIVAEFDAKKSKIKAFQANQHVGQQTVEMVSYRLEDLKSGTIKIYRVLEAA